jgi:hypothetical protein
MLGINLSRLEGPLMPTVSKALLKGLELSSAMMTTRPNQSVDSKEGPSSDPFARIVLARLAVAGCRGWVMAMLNSQGQLRSPSRTSVMSESPSRGRF